MDYEGGYDPAWDCSTESVGYWTPMQRFLYNLCSLLNW